MPPGFLGQWSPLPAQACGVFRIERDGYFGMADSEGYKCTLRRITTLGTNQVLKGEFVCRGESNSSASETAIFSMRDFEGSELMVVTEETKRAVDVLVLRQIGGSRADFVNQPVAWVERSETHHRAWKAARWVSPPLNSSCTSAQFENARTLRILGANQADQGGVPQLRHREPNKQREMIRCCINEIALARGIS